MLFYRLLTVVLCPAIVGHILWLSIKNKQSRYLWQRLGFSYSHLPANALLFHCASVGEVNTLLPLIKKIHQNNDQAIIITTSTATGAKIVDQQKLHYLHHSYLPFDWLNCVKRFLKCTSPAAVYIMETEIWPNLYTTCAQRGIPATLINARLSSKSTAANAWIKSILKQSLSKVNAIYARSDKDRDAYIKMGANKNITTTAGNLKLTTMLSQDHSEKKLLTPPDRKYVLFASTHNDEERQFYKQWKTLNRNELLIIAPRHPERSKTIIKQLNCPNIAIRSKGDCIDDKTKVYLLDTIGELNNYFSDASVVVMGGSFIAVGGHNILEPARYNRAIITGPHMENFKEELLLMLENKAILQATSIDELAVLLTKVLDDEGFKKTLQSNTAKITHDAQEVLDRYSQLILAAQKQKKGSRNHI